VPAELIVLLEFSTPGPVDDVVPAGKVVTMVEFVPNPTGSGSRRHPSATIAHANKPLGDIAQLYHVLHVGRPAGL
jgi:hypothetical protein